jgi:AAA-like domain
MIRIISPKSFYQVGGTVSADALSYVRREADQELFEHAAAGDFCYVLMPRQTGKSSLMLHTVAQLKKKRIRSVVIDLQGKIERGMAPDAFFAGLVGECIRQLKLPVQLDRWWREYGLLSAIQRFATFVADEVLPRAQKRVVVFIDEIDSTLNLNFSDDVFAAIRALYNERARNPAFKRLTFVLLGVAAPQDLIKDRARSPFNVGHRIELKDFTLAEAGRLIGGLPLEDKTAASRCLERVMDWTAGHPYLTQKVCAALAADEQVHRGARRVDELIEALFFSDETWSDVNLANVRDRIVEDKDNPAALLELYHRILVDERVLDDERCPVHTRLKLSGLVRVIPGGGLRPRNKIYERVFDLAWVDTLLRTTADIRLSTSQVIATQDRNTGSENLDLSAWQAQVAARLRAWASQRKRQRGGSVYAFLAAATLWPIVEKARAGDWTAPIVLGRVLAGVGGGMLANAMRNWTSEAQAAQQITALLAFEYGGLLGNTCLCVCL